MDHAVDVNEYKIFLDEINKQYTRNNTPALEEYLRARSDEYYNGTPTLPDWQYDALRDLLAKLDATSRFLFEVGSRPSVETRVKLSRKMLSLEKIKMDALEEWLRYKPPTCIAEIKADGVACQLVYASGKLHRGITRGDKIYGDDITRHVNKIPSIPQEIPLLRKYAEAIIIGEIVINKDVFQTHFQDHSNPRNTASGLLHRIETHDSSKLSFYAYGIYTAVALSDQAALRNFMNQIGFEVVHGWVVDSVKALRDVYVNVAENRDEYEYEIDGLVVKINNLAEQGRLGESATTPKWACCLKFEPKGAETELLDIRPQVGRTGEITPVAIVRPVNIDNVNITNITLHNYQRVKNLNLRKGDKVYVIRANDVIPRIERNNTMHDSEWSSDNSGIGIPDVCPVCGSELDKEWPKIFCRNTECVARSLMYVKHYIKVHRILGIGDEVLAGVDHVVSEPSDLYTLTPGLLESCFAGPSVIGWSRANNICKEIEKSRIQPLDKFIWGIGIPLVGEGKSRDIAQRAGDLQTFKKYINDPHKYMVTIDGIGDEIVKAITVYRNQIEARMEHILKYVTVSSIQVKESTKDCWSGYSFAITGTLSQPRNEFISLIEENGGAFNKNPTKTTSALIVGEDPGGKKLGQAEKNGIRVISEAEFINTLGKPGEIDILLQR